MTLQELKEKEPINITIQEAASIMGIAPQFLRAALIQERFPFGIAVKMTQNEFYINTRRFILYMEGADFLIKVKENDLS